MTQRKRNTNIFTVQEMMQTANPNRREDKGKTGMGNVIFPGTQLGFDIGQIRDFVKVQKRCKGFEFTTNANATIDEPLEISGDGVFFLGLNVSVNVDATQFNHSFKLMFNEEQLFAKVNGKFLNPALNPNKDLEFFPFPRPMSGSDVVTLSITSKISETVYVSAYYI